MSHPYQPMTDTQPLASDPAAPPDQSVPPPQPTQTLPVNTTVVGEVQYINGQAYIVQTQTKGPKVWTSYRGQASIIAGSLILACAILGVFLNVAGIIVAHNVDPWWSSFYIGHDLWGAVLFTIAGAFAIVAGKRKTTPTILTNMVMCICAIVISGIGQLVGTGMGVGMNAERARYASHHRRGDNLSMLAIHTVMLILTVTEIVAAVVSSTFCCAALCCRRQETTTTLVPLMSVGQPPNVAQQSGLPQTGDPQVLAYGQGPPSYTQTMESETKAPLPPDY